MKKIIFLKTLVGALFLCFGSILPGLAQGCGPNATNISFPDLSGLSFRCCVQNKATSNGQQVQWHVRNNTGDALEVSFNQIYDLTCGNRVNHPAHLYNIKPGETLTGSNFSGDIDLGYEITSDECKGEQKVKSVSFDHLVVINSSAVLREKEQKAQARVEAAQRMKDAEARVAARAAKDQEQKVAQEAQIQREQQEHTAREAANAAKVQREQAAYQQQNAENIRRQNAVIQQNQAAQQQTQAATQAIGSFAATLGELASLHAQHSAEKEARVNAFNAKIAAGKSFQAEEDITLSPEDLKPMEPAVVTNVLYVGVKAYAAQMLPDASASIAISPMDDGLNVRVYDGKSGALVSRWPLMLHSKREKFPKMHYRILGEFAPVYVLQKSSEGGWQIKFTVDIKEVPPVTYKMSDGQPFTDNLEQYSNMGIATLDLQTGHFELHSFSENSVGIVALVPSADYHHYYTLLHDGSLYYDGKLLLSLPEGLNAVYSELHLSPDGTKLSVCIDKAEHQTDDRIVAVERDENTKTWAIFAINPALPAAEPKLLSRFHMPLECMGGHMASYGRLVLSATQIVLLNTGQLFLITFDPTMAKIGSSKAYIVNSNGTATLLFNKPYYPCAYREEKPFRREKAPKAVISPSGNRVFIGWECTHDFGGIVYDTHGFKVLGSISSAKYYLGGTRNCGFSDGGELFYLAVFDDNPNLEELLTYVLPH